MLVIQWTKFSDVVHKAKWFWHKWPIPVNPDGTVLIPRGYLEGAAVKPIAATGLRICGVEMAFITTIPREIELGWESTCVGRDPVGTEPK